MTTERWKLKSLASKDCNITVIIRIIIARYRDFNFVVIIIILIVIIIILIVIILILIVIIIILIVIIIILIVMMRMFDLEIEWTVEGGSGERRKNACSERMLKSETPPDELCVTAFSELSK